MKHVKIQSDLLTEFWGTPTELGAWVLIPHGFDEHPDARYPIAIHHGHFPYTFGGWREEPPEPDLECEYSARFDLDCYNRIQQEHAWQLYQDWTSDDFPRMLVVEIQHPNPYYDDSYAVNSENLGPYGDAITYELIPEIERRYRGIGEGWSRFLYGGSTGGWESMAAQVLYPTTTTGRGSPVRTPSTSGRSRWSTSTRTKTPTTSTARSSGPPDPGGGTGRVISRQRSRR